MNRIFLLFVAFVVALLAGCASTPTMTTMKPTAVVTAGSKVTVVECYKRRSFIAPPFFFSAAVPVEKGALPQETLEQAVEFLGQFIPKLEAAGYLVTVVESCPGIALSFGRWTGADVNAETSAVVVSFTASGRVVMKDFVEARLYVKTRGSPLRQVYDAWFEGVGSSGIPNEAIKSADKVTEALTSVGL